VAGLPGAGVLVVSWWRRTRRREQTAPSLARHAAHA
jgi:hypothetical protein